jgi:polyhydroxyalkanoate synthase subunit PhaC
MRQGPKPLAMHIGLSSARLHNSESAAEKLSAMIRGIQLYHNAPFKRKASDYEILWQDKQTTLRLVKPHREDAVINGDICLMIPSLINGSEILDLSQDRSLAQYLYSQKMSACIIDWGDLKLDDPNLTLSELVTSRLRAAFHALKSSYPGKNIHVLGYCMGGTLALGLASLEAENLTSLSLLATPWNFHAGQSGLLDNVRFWSPSALASIKSNGYLGADYLQSLFAGIDPDLTRSKFSRFSQMDMASGHARIFIAVEDWLNDGKDLPGKIAKECISDWFLNNAPSAGYWKLDGKGLDISTIKIPVMIVASRKDRLVDYECAVDILQHIPHALLIEPDCGHIGMIAGERCVEQVWQPLAEWMKLQGPSKQA